MRSRKLLALLLIGALATPLWAQMPTIAPMEQTVFLGNAGIDGADTVVRSSVGLWCFGARQVVFRVQANNTNQCSTTTVEMSNNDTGYVTLAAPMVTSGVVHDLDLSSGGGRNVTAFAVDATGSNHVYWRFVRLTLRMKANTTTGGPVDSLRIRGSVIW